MTTRPGGICHSRVVHGSPVTGFAACCNQLLLPRKRPGLQIVEKSKWLCRAEKHWVCVTLWRLLIPFRGLANYREPDPIKIPQV